MKTKVSPNHYVFKILKEKSPNSKEFFCQTYEGNYYDRARVEYTDETGKVIHEQAGYYG